MMKLLRLNKQPLGLTMIVFLLTWQIGQPLQAATFYWDSDATAAGNTTAGVNLGGTGNWDTTTANWWNTTNDVAWPNVNTGNTDLAIFSGAFPSLGIPAINTVTLSSGIIANSLSFVRSGYTLTGGALTLDGTTPTLRANLGESATINSQILGTVGLTKTGGGSVRLGNVNNTYTGTTTINDGILSIASAAALGSDTSAIVINGSATRGFVGGALLLDGGYSSGVNLTRAVSLQGQGPTALGSALISVRNNSVSSLSNGPGTVNTAISSASGRLTIGDLTVTGTTGTTFLTLGVANAVGVGSYAITGTLSGAGSIQKTGSGTLLLTPTTATGFSGTIRISAGSVRIGSVAVLGTNAGTTTSGTLDMNAGILEIMSNSSLAIGKTVYGRVGSTLFVDHAVGGSALNGTHTFGSFAFEENQTFTFNGRNGYGITFTTSPVQGGNNNTTLTNNLSGLLTFTGAFWSNTEDTAARTMTINGTGDTLISGNFTASSATFDHVLTKAGAGILTITSTGSTLDGAVNIQAGTLAITDFRSITNNTAAINIGATTVAGTLNIGTATAATAAGLTTSKVINLSGTTGGATINANQAGANPVILNAAFTATGAGAKTLTLGGTSTSTVDNIINGAIVDSSTPTTSLVKTDANTWVLAGTNSYTGSTTISGGTLKIKANAATTSTVVGEAAGNTVIFNTNATTLAAGGTLEFTGFSGSATTENLGALTPTAGAGTIRLTAATVSPAATNLTFSSLGATTAASSVNFITTGASGGLVTLTGQAATSATTLPGTANFLGHLYINGADFAAINGSAQVFAPTYGTTTGFVNGGAALTATNHNLVNAAIAAQALVTVTSLKMTTNNLTMLGNLTLSTGALLQTGGSATLDGTAAGGAELIQGGATGTNIAIRVDGASDVLTLGANINIASAQTGGLTKNGAGRLVIQGVNAQTGATTINEGTVQLSGSGRLSASSVALDLRQGATLDLNGLSSGVAIAAFNGAGTVTNSNAAAATLLLYNVTTGAGTFSGVIQDGTGVTNVSVTGTTGAPVWSGLNTYTGVTTIGTGLATTAKLVSVNTLANIGTASGIGRGLSTNDTTNAASLVFGGLATAGINYTGTTSVSIDRLFTLAGNFAGAGAQIANASGNNSALIFNKTNAITFASGLTNAQTLTLGGASTGDNQINLQIVDNGALATGVTKIGAGQWILGNSSNNYTGTTQIGSTTTAGGVLIAAGNALSPNSPLLLGGTTGGGVFQTSGNFTRNITATPANGTGTVTFNSTLTTGAVGFAASDSKLVVAIGGLALPTALTWGSGGFMGVTGTSTGALVLSSATALDEVEFRNAIDLNAAVRTIQVDDNANTGTDFATITGVISGTGGLTKTGTGTLQLFGANTYSGPTAVTAASTLVVNSLGLSTGATVGTSVGTSSGANLAANAITLGNAGTTAGILQYVGTGETSDRMIRLNTTTGSTQIHADGSGALILTNVLNDMAAGNKTLFLRGNNTQGNMITSVLADNTAGTNTLGITADMASTWILSGNNTYTGITDITAGLVGAGSDTAFGTGTLRVRNGTLFAYGGDRTLTNVMSNQGTTTAVTSSFMGDYSLNLTGNWDHTITSVGHTITNSIVAGKSLTLGGNMTFNAITATRTLTINGGSGDTNLNGNITTSTAFGVNLAYSGTGTLTLGGTITPGNGALTVSSGTVKLGASDRINNGVGAADVTFSPATTVSATFDLAGFSETINGLSANPAGNVTINNSSASASTLTVGDNNGVVAFGGGAGANSITQTGGGAINLIKIGSGTANFTGTLGNTGSTTVTGGVLNYNSTTATSALSVGTGSTLNLKGGLTTPANLTSVTVAGGGSLSFADGSGTPFNNLTTLSLGLGSGTATLELEAGELGTDTLTLLTPNVATTVNTINLLVKDFDITSGNTYNLLVAPGGGLLTGGGSTGTYTFSLAGYSGSTLLQTDTLVSITAGTLITSDVYWAGATSPATTAWNNIDGTLNTNFSTDLAGTIQATTLPGKGQKVIFQADNITGGAALSTTLEQPFKINALEFRQSTTPANTARSVTIAPGSTITNALTIVPSASTDGINLKTGATPLVTISAPVVAGLAQTWTTADAVALTGGTSTTTTSITVASTTGLRPGMTITGAGITAGTTIVSVDSLTGLTLSAATTAFSGQSYYAAQQLNLSGGLSGTGNVTKAGSGKVVLSAASTGYTGTFAVSGGIAEATLATALSGVGATPNSGALISINSGGTFYYNNATADTGVGALNFANSIRLNGGTLSAGGNTRFYSGNINVNANSAINLRDLANATISTTQRSVTLSGVLSGAGKLTLDSINTASSGNQLTGTLTLSNASPLWSGGLDFIRGTVAATNVGALGTGPITAVAGRIQFATAGGTTFNLPSTQTITLDGVGAVFELSVDASGTPVSDMTVNVNGAITLGSSINANAALRIFTGADNLSVPNIKGGIVLANNASISVAGSATRLVTIDTVGISETGGARVLTINDDLGGWAQTNQNLTINVASTYTGGTILTDGKLRLGNKSALGTGTLTFTLGTISASTDLTGANAVANAIDGAGAVVFDGNFDLELSGGVTLSAARSFTANGAVGADLILSGAINAAGNSVTLDGTGTGFLTGGITQSGTAADLSVNAGTWTLSGTTNIIADDVINTGATVVLNLNSTGVLTGLSGTSNGLYARTGATINLNANDAYSTSTGLDFILLGDTTTGGATLNTNTFNITTPRLDVGQATSGWTASVIGTGTVTVGTNINLYQGTVSAGLAGAGAVLKAFGGTVTLSGNNSGLTGATAARVDAGNLILDYTTSNTAKLLATTGLDMRGGTLTLNGNAAATTSQTVASFTLASGGANRIDVNSNGFATTLNLGAITRAALANDGTIRFELPVAGAITTTTANTNGILGGYATVTDAAGVTNFAANDGSNNIVAITSTAQDSPLLWAAGQNITDSAGISGSRQFMSINSLRFNANAASAVTVSSGGFFNLASGGVLMTAAAATGAHTISGGTLTSGTGELTFIQDSTAQGLSISSMLTGGTGITKAGLGTLTLSGNNNYTGQTDIQAGTLVASGGNAIGDSSTVTLADDQASTFQITSNETIGTLASGGNATAGFLLGTVAVGSNILTINQTATATYAGVFTGIGGIIRNGTSGATNLLLTGASGSGFTGSVTLNGGLTYLEGLGSMDASSITVNKGASFLISNNGSTRTSTRLLDTASIILNSADGSWSGETRPSGLAVRTDQNATTSETIGVLAFASGASYFRGDASGTTGIAGILTNNFTRSNNATLDARGRALGGSTGDRNQLRISDATNQTAFIATLIGGSGAAGTKNVSIVPWAFGETTTAGLADANMGNTLVTYVTGTGIRPLDLTTEYNTFGGAPTATDNIRESLAADLTGIAGTTINALVLNNSNTTAGTVNVTGTGAGQTLNVTSGTMLFTGTAAVTGTPAMGIVLGGFNNGITVGATNEYVIFVQNPTSAAAGGIVTATISSQLSSTADITKSGRGTLILDQVNSAGGNTRKTTINEGTLQIADLDNIGGNTGGLVFAGGTLRLGAGFTDDVSSRTISFLLGGGTIDTNGISLSLTNAFGTAGAGGFTKADSNGTPGNLTLSGASGIAGYTGTTSISGGRLILGSGVNNRLSTSGALALSGAGGLQLGNGTGASDQTVSELSSASTTSFIVGGDAALSTLTVNQSTSTTYAGLIGGAGTNENNIALVKNGIGTLTLGAVANTFTGGIRINAGTLAGANNDNTYGANTNVITLGAAAGTADATLSHAVTGTYANPINVASGSSGALTLFGNSTGTGAPTFSGAITLANNLIIAKSGTTGIMTVSGGITGTGNIVIGNTGTTGAIQLTTNAVNHAGSITNSGYATATTLISANIGSNVTDIIQNSATSALTLSGTSIAYSGATNVANGTLNITGDVFGGSRSRTTLIVAGGATLNTNNTAGQIVNLSGAISLGAGSGTTTLGLDIGNLTNFDQFASSAAATTANAVVLNLTGIGGITAGDYDLLTATGGLNTASYSFTASNAGGVSFVLSTAPTYVRLTANALAAGNMYWGGAVNTSWAAFNGSSDSNFATNIGGTNAKGTPGINNNVIFSTSTQTGTSLATTLDGVFSIRDLTFNSQTGTGPVASISIAPGSGGTLTLTPTAVTDGINLQTGAPATITISAPVVLGTSQTWTVADAPTNLTVSGSITGTANLAKEGAGIVTLSGTNLATYVGTTTVNGGVLRAGAATSFNAASAYTIGAAGTLRLNSFANTIASLAGSTGAIVENGVASGNVVLTVGDSTSTTFAGTLQNGAAATLAITKVGTGTLTLSGTNTYTGSTLVNAGVLAITGSTTMGAGSLTVGNNAAGSRARAQIGTGASLTVTTLFAGSNATAAGGIYQTDGSLLTTAADGTNTGMVLGNAASAGYGYYKLSGGSLTSNRITIGGNAFANATGVFEQTGGTSTFNVWTVVSQTGGSNALLDISGGTLNSAGSFALNHGSSSYAVVNVRGTGTINRTAGSISLMQGNASSLNNVGIMNLLTGGTIRTNTGGIVNGAGTGSSGNLSLLNFNGGTLVTNAASTTLVNISTTAHTANSGAYIYSGGLTVDTNSLNSTINGALLAPTGAGVSTIAVTSGGSGYIGAPLIKITGGTGVGATAVANMVDDGTGNGTFSIGTITITSPGTGYVNTDILTLAFGDNTSVYTTQAVLGAVVFNTGNTSGGLVKAGSGTLTLSGANTYTGGTTINLGTLALGATDVLANTGNVTINGGTFDAATFNDTVATVSLQSGSITGSTGVLSSTANFDLQSGTVSFTGAGGLGGSVNVNKTTSGTVTLSSNGLGSFANVVNVTAGTLAFSTASQLGNASATNTLTVNGGALSYTGVGAVSLAANQVVSLGASHGTLNTSQSTGIITYAGGISGASTGNLTKSGAGTVIILGTSSWNSGGSSVTVSDGTLQAGFGTSGIAALTVGATGNMNLTNSTAEILTLGTSSGALTISGGARFAFELGAGNANASLSIGDQIIVGTGGSALTSGGTITLDFINLGGALTAGNFNLFSDPNGLGGLLTGGTIYALGSAPSGFNYTINQTANLISLNVVNFVPIYWRGGADTSWSTLGAAPANWTTDVAGNTDALAVPGTADTVIFSSSPVAGAAVTTTLDGNFTIDGLQFRDNGNVTPVTSVTINPGITTPGILTLAPSSTSGGINVATNAGAVIIAAPVVANGAVVTSQAWNVAGGGANGSSLTVSGNLTITDLINKTGAGSLTLSGSNSGAGGITLTGGTLNINSTTALGTGVFTIGAGTTLDASSVTIINASNNLQTWNGSFGFTGTNSLDLGTGAVTLGGSIGLLASANTLTIGGVIDDGSSTFGLTKAGAGTLTLNGVNAYDGLTDLTAGILILNGNNSGAAGGVTMATGTQLRIGHNNAGTTNAFGTGTFTINGGTIDNTSGSTITANGGNNVQAWNGNFTFTGTNSLNLGNGAVTLGANTQITTTASTLTAGAVTDGASVFGITKAGAGTLVLGGVSTYDGATVINEGTLRFSAGTQSLAAASNTLTFGTAGGTTVGSLDLSSASATFGGATVVQTNSASANTITIGTGQTLRLNGAVTVGAATGPTITNLTVTGLGTLTIGAAGAPTNANVQLGNSATSNQSNAATWDMTGLSTFYANLGSGTFRVGDPTNSGGAGTAGSTLNLAPNSTIIATTITSDSPANTVTQAIKLGTGTNVLQATTITIGGAANRATGSLDFFSGAGTVQIRDLAGTGRASMNVQNGNATTGSNLFGTVDFTGHSADLLLGSVAVGGRSGAASANGTGIFSFDTGTLDATTITLAARTGTTSTSGNVTGTLNLGGGTSTITTLTMATNSVTTAASTGDATGNVNISGGTNTIGTLTMGVNTAAGATSTGSDTNTTLTITGGVTSVNTAFSMGAQNSANNAATTVNSAISALNISAGSLTLTGSTNLTMGSTTLDVNNAATSTISITGTGTLTVGGNITYAQFAGSTVTNSITLNGGTLDMTSGNIGATATPITFNAQSGILSNLAELNGGGATAAATLDKTTAGTLLLNTSNAYTGFTTVTAGVLRISNGSALGAVTRGTTVSGTGAALEISNNITTTAEALILNGTGVSSGGALRSTAGTNIYAGNITLNSASRINADAGSLTLDVATGNAITSTNLDLTLGGVGNIIVADAIALGTGGLTKDGAGTATLSAANTYTGKTIVNAGKLSISNENNLGTNPGVAAADQLTLNGGTLLTTANLTIDDSNRGVTLGASGGTFETATSTTATVANIITGAGALNKTGAGTLVLTAANDYSGGTTVSAGTLEVNNTTSSGTGSAGVTVSNTGTKLSGSGSIAGSTIIGSGTILAPGVGSNTDTSNRTLAFTAASTSLTVADTGVIQLGLTTADSTDTNFATWFNANNGTAAGYITSLGAGGAAQLAAWNATPTGNHDYISAAGTIILGSSATTDKRIVVSLNNATGLNYGSIFNLLDWSTLGTKDGTSLTAMSGTGAFNVLVNLQLGSLTGGLGWDTSLFSSNGILVVVPEPSRALFLMFGLLGLMLRRRRRSGI